MKTVINLLIFALLAFALTWAITRDVQLLPDLSPIDAILGTRG